MPDSSCKHALLWAIFLNLRAAICGHFQKRIFKTDMPAINYYNLLKEGPTEVSISDWEQVSRSIASFDGDAPTEFDAASDALQNLLFECSQDWLDKRFRIVQKAENASLNPSRRSDYCLRSLQNLASEAAREARMQEESPEMSLVRRQVTDHLRKLASQKVLNSYRTRSKSGQDICNRWTLAEWGNDWRERPPEKDLEQLKAELPWIQRNRGGKGIFDYAEVLPSYIRMVLETYGSALSTSEICSVIVSKISPPLFRNVMVSDLYEETDQPEEDWQWGEIYSVRSAEELFAARQSHELFMAGLSERELKILEMKEDETPIEKIAEVLGCSAKTVNNDWKNIFDKGRRLLLNS
ncbi:MAG: LuxR C-terminal-related transcriptional regulator [Desulfomonilaceae bacterium]